MAGPTECLEEFEIKDGFEQFRYVASPEQSDVYHLHGRLMVMQLPPESTLAGKFFFLDSRYLSI